MEAFDKFWAILNGAKLYWFSKEQHAIFVNGKQVAITLSEYQEIEGLCYAVREITEPGGMMINDNKISTRWSVKDEMQFSEVPQELHSKYMIDFRTMHRKVMEIDSIIMRRSIMFTLVNDKIGEWYNERQVKCTNLWN